METIREVKFEELYDILDKIKIAHEKEEKTLTFAQTIEKLATFLPNIAFRHFMELKAILRDHDSVAYDKFINDFEHEYITFDRTGTSEKHFEFWEIMLDMEDSTLGVFQQSGEKDKYEKMLEAKELNKIAQDQTNGNYLVYRTMFLKKYGKVFPQFSARLNKVEAGLKELEPNCSKFLAKLVNYCTKNKDTKLLELVLNRVDYLLDDIRISHPSNQEYINKIRKISNN